jgi:isoaspartyl peptidase/L-asparaginase-like protein (Ntn-hydrolase superfamily)
MGIICVDAYGKFGAAHNSLNMCWAYMDLGMSEPREALTGKIVK